MNVLTLNALDKVLSDGISIDNIVCFYQMDNEPAMTLLDAYSKKYVVPATADEILECIKAREPKMAEKFIQVSVFSNMVKYSCIINGTKITKARYAVSKYHMTNDSIDTFVEVVIHINSENFNTITSVINEDVDMELLQLKLKLASIGIELMEEKEK